MEKLDAIGKGEVVKNKYCDEYPDLYETRYRDHIIMIRFL